MKFVPVEHTPVLCSIWETRTADYASFADAEKRAWARPNFKQDKDHPVVGVTWDDAQAFCAWLTRVERQNGWLAATHRYRLPTAHEWSCAAGYGAKEDPAQPPMARLLEFSFTAPWGKQWPPPAGAGNFADATLQRDGGALLTIKGYDDGYAYTAPVGSFTANQFGLYDLAGNAMEWCDDWLDRETQRHILRGGSWNSHDLHSVSVADHMSSFRYPTEHGFRCVLELAGPER
jgi:formylglycine-generating enzyme required for sulfatase activity